MLRFDKAIIYSPLVDSNLSVSFSIKIYGSEVFLFSELINIVSIFNWMQFHCIDLIMLLYMFFEISFDWY